MKKPSSPAATLRELFEAAMYGKVTIAKRAMAKGANPNRVLGGRTSLHWAVQEGHLSMVRCLIRGGANINKRENYGFPPLRNAAAEGHVPILKELIKAGANLDLRDIYGCTALHLACAYGKKKCVEVLLKAGAIHDLKDKGGLTPRWYAAAHGHKDILDMLPPTRRKKECSAQGAQPGRGKQHRAG